MIEPQGDLVANIELLLKHANPDGEAYLKLSKYLDHAKQNVMLGPKPRAYISSLFAKLDNIECAALNAHGVCVLLSDGCEYVDDYSKCPFFKAQKPEKVKAT